MYNPWARSSYGSFLSIPHNDWMGFMPVKINLTNGGLTALGEMSGMQLHNATPGQQTYSAQYFVATLVQCACGF